ncbi:shikimate kinase [Bacteroidia bacterium]|nr:shikimate kinase [Bacteroidia bacterium]
MRKIFLIGYMGAGKTTIGKRLAKKLGLQFIDMDQFIENRYHKKVSEIFAEKGEDFFREIERKALQEVAQFEDTVISTGGGAPCFFDNMELMNRSGITVYLKVPVNVLAQRLSEGKQERPLVKDKSKEELQQFIAGNVTKRETWYNQASVIYPAGKIISPGNRNAMVEELTKRLNEQKT